MYQAEDLKALFRACDPEERIRYLFFLQIGGRDKEVRFTTWSDIDFNRKCVRVTAKKQLGFKPEDEEERELELSAPKPLQPFEKPASASAGAGVPS